MPYNVSIENKSNLDHVINSNKRISIYANTPQQFLKNFTTIYNGINSQRRSNPSSESHFAVEEFFHQELEKGCWVVYTDITYSQGAVYELLMDPDQVGDYFVLNLNSSTPISSESTLNRLIERKGSQFTWVLFKPLEKNFDLFFPKGSSRNITLFFNREWLEDNLVHNQLYMESKLPEFIDSNKKNIFYPGEDEKDLCRHFENFHSLVRRDEKVARTDLLSLRFYIMNVIFDFFEKCKQSQIVNRALGVRSKSLSFDVLKVKTYLLQNLNGKFPGLAHISKYFNISESKLKSDFKASNGMTLFQFFQQEQMKHAEKILLESNLSIKEISYILGYENTSKFSAAFKKRIGVCPSEIKNTRRADNQVIR